jgi:AraC-like DNA-binding protein/ligand-binding sensor protein
MRDSATALALEKNGRTPRLVEQLAHLELCQNYLRAFGEAVGLPLIVVSSEKIHASSHETPHQNSFCKWLARHHSTCKNCFYSQLNQLTTEGSSPHTETCFAGLCKSSVPIRMGNTTIGFLRTGGIATQKPTQAKFAKLAGKLREQGVHFDENLLCQAYFSTRIMSQEHYRSILDLLTVFAGHLSLIVGQLILRNGNSETTSIHRAREYIKEHFTEPLTLQQVAECAHLSSCYFCKKFKESTGLSLTEYITRTRVEAAKALLNKPTVRISEVAFEVGFQSLTHFNRAFKEIAGQSPTQYRRELPAVNQPVCR